MSEQPLLPQEVVLLCTAWHRTPPTTSDKLVGDDWHDLYETRLENTMGDWLVDGLLAWQVAARRTSAFVPVGYRIGTSRDDLSHVDSLARLVAALIPERDYHYAKRPSADAADDEQSDVMLGICLGTAAALAVRRLAAQFPQTRDEARQRYDALLDALALVQMVKPFKAEDPLCDAWEYLFAGTCRVDVLGTAYARSLRHRFVLAMYPLAHAGMKAHRIARLVDSISRGDPTDFGSTGWADLCATRAIFFADPVDYIPAPDPDPRFARAKPPTPDWSAMPHLSRITPLF